MPGADHGGADQFGRDLVRVEQVCGRADSGRVRRLAAGRVRKSPDGQLHVVPELLAQFLSGGGGPRRQPDRERRPSAKWQRLTQLWVRYVLRGVRGRGATPIEIDLGALILGTESRTDATPEPTAGSGIDAEPEAIPLANGDQPQADLNETNDDGRRRG